MGSDRNVSPVGLLVADKSYNSGPNRVVWNDSLIVVLEKINEAYFAPWNGSRIGTWSVRLPGKAKLYPDSAHCLTI